VCGVVCVCVNVAGFRIYSTRWICVLPGSHLFETAIRPVRGDHQVELRHFDVRQFLHTSQAAGSQAGGSWFSESIHGYSCLHSGTSPSLAHSLTLSLPLSNPSEYPQPPRRAYTTQISSQSRTLHVAYQYPSLIRCEGLSLFAYGVISKQLDGTCSRRNRTQTNTQR
jgi:hypothetical protein